MERPKVSKEFRREAVAQNIACDGGQELTGATPDFLYEACGKEVMDEICAGNVVGETDGGA